MSRRVGRGLGRVRMNELVRVLSRAVGQRGPTRIVRGSSLAAVRGRILGFVLLRAVRESLCRGSVRRRFRVEGPAIAKVLGLVRGGNCVCERDTGRSTHLGRVVPARGTRGVHPTVLGDVRRNRTGVLQKVPGRSIRLYGRIL